MANYNQQQPQASKTDAQKVRQQNQQAAQSAGGYNSYQEEYASETNAQQVRQQNQQSQAAKNRNQNATQNQPNQY
ncbi:gamma-type small acid-soluble spore protein [Hazenella sp. IB182357]|uniref:Small, acid-soluble spore protein gamma-type n=1 Tax=Polycladospora coralii TaxID=2771432 RepID=A0A926RTD5_9BACL|nr:gamma-type small acid-soluble spore protein [Polycladospora coralii]MBD1371024.1 gamma-type small acid-soluble spore protein [Polycladospora coralii]MBS7529964.1 gamma-type small acid-soluble spore protein [Polycladospora coralii]